MRDPGPHNPKTDAVVKGARGCIAGTGRHGNAHALMKVDDVLDKGPPKTLPKMAWMNDQCGNRNRILLDFFDLCNRGQMTWCMEANESAVSSGDFCGGPT